MKTYECDVTIFFPRSGKTLESAILEAWNRDSDEIIYCESRGLSPAIQHWNDDGSRKFECWFQSWDYWGHDTDGNLNKNPYK